MTTATFSDPELREEVDTFVFTGHGTTSSAISFTLYCLAKHPDIQEVYQELLGVLDADFYISYEKTSSLKCMELVIKETLRVYPIAPIFLRRLTEDITHNGFLLPKGLNVGIFAYGAHQIEEIYENPTKFDPERCNPEKAKNRDAYAYVPFSAGPRNCIGQKFATLEMKCFLSSSPSVEVVLKSVNGVIVNS